MKKPAAIFEAVFSGPNVVPEKIPINTVARILSSVHRLATGEEGPEDEGEEELGDDSSVGLLDIKRGSAVFRFTALHPEDSLNRLRLVGSVLRNPEDIGESSYMLGPLANLSSIARSLGCSLELRKPNKQGVIVKIEPSSFDAVSKSIFIHGETALTGKIERVGGATRQRCGLRVSFQPRMLICDVASAEIARKLGEKLYQEVVAHGTATWFKSSWKIFSFAIKSVHQLKPGSLMESIEAIRDAGAKSWDDIEDPQEFLEGIGTNLT